MCTEGEGSSIINLSLAIPYRGPVAQLARSHNPFHSFRGRGRRGLTAMLPEVGKEQQDSEVWIEILPGERAGGYVDGWVKFNSIGCSLRTLMGALGEDWKMVKSITMLVYTQLSPRQKRGERRIADALAHAGDKGAQVLLLLSAKRTAQVRTYPVYSVHWYLGDRTLRPRTTRRTSHPAMAWNGFSWQPEVAGLWRTNPAKERLACNKGPSRRRNQLLSGFQVLFTECNWRAIEPIFSPKVHVDNDDPGWMF